MLSVDDGGLVQASRALYVRYAHSHLQGDASTDLICGEGHRHHALQVDLYRWQLRNFAQPDIRDVALGVVEELGELYTARRVGAAADIEDAVGDAWIYAGQLCMLSGLSLEPLLLQAPADKPPCHVEALGCLCHTVLKRHQRIRGFADAAKYQAALLTCLSDLLVGLTRDPAALYHTVASQVLLRTWRP